MSKKRVPEEHEMLMYSSEIRVPRRAPLSQNGATRAKQQPRGGDTAAEKDADNHRKAIAEYRERCKGTDPWVCAEALLYLVDGDRLIEKHALWLFPSDSERFLISRNDNGDEEFYVLVRLEGKACLDKLSLGVCRDKEGGFHDAHGTLSEIDPTEGQVVRIVSIEEDGQPLPTPDEASPHLQHAKHMREVIRKHAGKCEAGSGSAPAFRVLRTQKYLAAREIVASGDCGPDEWKAALLEMENPSSFPWRLANRVAQLQQMDKLRELEKASHANGGRGERVHVVDDIYLVTETLPTATSEFVAAARWAVQKSIRGTGSIPKAKMWEPVVIADETFQLMRMA